MDIEFYLKEAVKRIIESFNPEKIILFGFYTYGTPSSDSDIDLMVIMKTQEMPHKRAVRMRKILKAKDIILRPLKGLTF